MSALDIDDAECPRCECAVRSCMCAASVAGIRTGNRPTIAELAAATRRSNEAFDAASRQEFAATGAVIRKTAPGGRVSLTKSTRAGIAYQVTSWDETGEPTGHIDATDLTVAIGTLRTLAVRS
jgi:hypothetical protein